VLVQKLLPEQGLLEDRERWLAVLKFFDEVDEIGPRLDARWAAQPSDQGPAINATRWQELEAEVAKIIKVSPPSLSLQAEKLSRIGTIFSVMITARHTSGNNCLKYPSSRVGAHHLLLL
jgi:hypothetical protein